MILIAVLQMIVFGHRRILNSKAEVIRSLEGAQRKSECSAVVLEIEKTSKSYLFRHLKIVVEWVVRLCSEYNFIKSASPPYIFLHLILTFLFGWKSFH